MILAGLVAGELDGERGSVTGDRVGDDPSVVGFGDRSRDGKAQTAAAAVASAAGVEPVEPFKDVRLVSQRYAGAVIHHRKYNVRAVALSGQGKVETALAAVLQCVVHQDCSYASKSCRISIHYQSVCPVCIQPNVPQRCYVLELAVRVSHHFGKIDRCKWKRTASVKRAADQTKPTKIPITPYRSNSVSV